ncbi:MAG: T9SS type A sorting domain-containing protein [Rhodothermales bacterium]|nr:T9SS type A sorting domain-containing protein [Rhodothermales bacterium]
MTTSLRLIALLMLTVGTAQAQLAAPDVETVWGGRVLDIDGYASGSGTTRVFVATESANTLFYADMSTGGGSLSFGGWNVVPSVDADDDYGQEVNVIAAHPGSGYVFFSHPDHGLLKTSPSSSTPDIVDPGFASDIMVHNDTLLFVAGPQLYVGTVDASGNTTVFGGLATGTAGFMHSIDVHPWSDSVYVFTAGSSPSLVKSNATLGAFTSTTTFSTVDVSSLSSSVDWKAFAIAPSGRLFIVGDTGTSKHVAYSDDESTWTQGSVYDWIAGNNIGFQGDSTAYSVYFASVYNATNGVGSWSEFGNSGLETHPNDGPVFADPNDPLVVLMTTDQGIGATTDGGATIAEIDDGLEAVQVNDFDMIASKTEGWLASKSGVRHVSGFLSSPSWTNAMFPMGDGAPYFSIEIDPQDNSYVYAGNNRVYRTTDAGSSWTRLFTPEDPPYNFPMVGTHALAIEVAPFDSLLIMAGYEVQGGSGGLFWSGDRGANWDQILLQSSSAGGDVNVTDVVFEIEGADTLAYVSAEYGSGRSVYKVTKSGSTWTAQQDMNGSGTSTGSAIVASIMDLQESVSGDTLYAVGTDAGINHPIAYFKDLTAATPLWTPLTTSGFPFVSGKQATAAAVGGDTLFVGVDHEVYAFRAGGSSWNLGYSYPVGTNINMLFYDELLVGTGTGIYAHFNHGTSGTSSAPEAEVPTRVRLDSAYPNPFNPTTVIEYALPQSGRVRLAVYDALGRRMAMLADGVRPAGTHAVRVDASSWAVGTYFVVLETGSERLSRPVTLIK